MIRGHNGSFVFGNGEEFDGYDFVAERPQVTHDSKIKNERIEVGKVDDTSLAHFTNFCESAIAGKPDQVNCSPELGAAAMVIVKLGSRELPRRQGVPLRPRDDDRQGRRRAAGPRAGRRCRTTAQSPKHMPGWKAGDTGSKLYPREYQKLAGPWINGEDPAGNVAAS